MSDKDKAMQQALEALDSDNPDIQLRAAVTLRAAMELPVPEPVALHDAWSLREVYFDEDGEPSMHRSPPQRPWQGLTDEEMSDIVADIDVDFGDLLWKVVCLTKIIEATLKERNK